MADGLFHPGNYMQELLTWQEALEGFVGGAATLAAFLPAVTAPRQAAGRQDGGTL